MGKIPILIDIFKSKPNSVTEWSDIPPIWIKRAFGVAICLTLSVFLLNFALVGFGVYGDGLGYYAPLRSLLFDGDLKITNEYEYYAQSASSFGGGVRATYPLPEYSKYTIGMGLILFPFYAIGHLVALLLSGLGVDVTTDGLSWVYELFYCLGSIGLGIAGLFLCYKASSHIFSRFSALIAVIGVWFASPLTFYLCLESSMSHPVSQFLVSLFLYLCVLTSWIHRRRQQVLIGLILGLAVLVRPQNLLFASVPLILATRETYFAVASKKQTLSTAARRKLSGWIYIKAIAVMMGAMSLLVLLQWGIYQWQYGGVWNSPYLQEGATEGYGSSFHWGNPEILNVLFSGYRGLFIWHPLLGLAIIGVILAFRLFPTLAGTLLLAFGLQVYLIASWWCWWQGASFGGRMFSNCTFIFVLGLSALWEILAKIGKRWLGIGITLFLIAWNVLLVMQYESAMIPPEAPISIAQLFKNQFFVIPFFLEHIFNR